MVLGGHGPMGVWYQGVHGPGVVHGPRGVHDPGGCMVPGGAWSRAVRILLECILVWFCVNYFPLLRLRDF